MTPRRAVVVGGGVGGLAAAGSLVRAGWHVTLLEQQERLRAAGAALLIWPNGVHALRALGHGPGLEGISTVLPGSGFRRPDGRWLARVDAAGIAQHLGAPVVAVRRQDLHDALVAGLRGVDVRAGVAVSRVRCRPDALPAVGDRTTWWEAELVVAADGQGSVVRAAVAPEARVATAGYVAWCALLPSWRAPDVPVASETLGAGHRFLAVQLGRRGVYWAATAPGAPRPEPPAFQLELLRRWFTGWHAPIGELLAATEPGHLLQHAVADLNPMPRRFAVRAGGGGFALLGDAAHAMTPNLGQGACLALEDAVTLAAFAGVVDAGEALHAALDRYDRARRPRAARLVRQSRRIGTLLQARRPVAVRARNALLTRMPASVMDRVAVSSAGWQP